MNNYRGTAIANFNYLIAIVLFLTISPLSIMPIITGGIFMLGGKLIGIYTPFLVTQGIITFVVIIFWILNKGLLPVHDPDEKLGGVTVIMVANILLLIGFGIFLYFLSQSRGGGTISGVPLALWLMLLMPLHVIGMGLTEWKRWSDEGSTVVRNIVTLVIVAPAVFYATGILIF